MTASHVEKSSSSSRVGVSWSEGMIRLRDEDLFARGSGDRCVIFLRHVFALSEVISVEIDCDFATASIHYDAGLLGLPEFLERLAAALRGQLRRISQHHRVTSCAILHIPPAGSGFSGWAPPLRLGTSSMTGLEEFASATRRFAAIRALASRLRDALEQCSRRDRVRGMAGYGQRAHPIRAGFDQPVVSFASSRSGPTYAAFAGLCFP